MEAITTRDKENMTAITPATFFPKQQLALHYLGNTSEVRRVLYGGAASGGKSFLGQHWQIMRRLKYPRTNGFIGRASLTDLRKFTLPEMWSEMAKYGLKADRGVRFNGQDFYFDFFNGSRIYLVDMFAYPSDPDFQRFGSSAFFDGFVEEAAEITEKAVNIIGSRIRQKITDFCRSCCKEGLNTGTPIEFDEAGRTRSWQCPSCRSVNGGMIPKMLITCNPSTGWLRSEFYDLWNNGTLPPDRMFIPATVEDNPKTSVEYIELLKGLPEMDRKRLLYGDWDYSEAADAMFNYADIQAAFTDRTSDGEYWITADIARLGKDRTVIGVWHGLTLVEILELTQTRINDTADAIRNLALRYNVKVRNIIADEDGVGGGVVDLLRCTEFKNGGSPVDSTRYSKAKDECYFKLAQYFEHGRIGIRVSEKRDVITKELQAVRREKPDGDTKLSVISKDKMKALLNGRSPDYADMLMMRMKPEIQQRKGIVSVRGINLR